MKFSVNLNEYVRFKLTDAGRAARKKFHDDLMHGHPSYMYLPLPVDLDGYSREQLWTMMQEFGPAIHLAGPTLFERNELIFEGDPK